MFHRQQVQFLDITLSTEMVRKHGLQVLKNGPSLKKVTQAKLLHHATGDRWTLDMTDSFCPIQKKKRGPRALLMDYSLRLMNSEAKPESARKEGKKVSVQRTFFALVSARWLLLMRDDYKLIDPF